MQTANPQDIHLSHYWNVLRRRWKIALAIVTTVLAVTLVASYLTKPLYRSKITLQIEREDPGQVTVEDIFMIEPSSQEFLQTQYALLKSRGLAERVVDDLKLIADPEFNPGGAAKQNETDRKNLRQALANKVLGGIEVVPVRGTSLVEIFYIGSSPRLAERIANGMGDSFIAVASERKFESVRQASTFLTSEIDQLKADVDGSERQLQTYSQSKGIISLTDKGNIIVEKLSDLNQDLTASQARRIEKEANYNTLRARGAAAIPEVANNGTVISLRTVLAQTESEFRAKSSDLKPDHPDMIRLKAQIEKVRQDYNRALSDAASDVLSAAQSEYRSAASQEQATRSALNQQKQEAMAMNSDAVTYTNLKNEIESKRTLLDQLSKKLNETEVTARLRGAASSNIRFVDRAELPGGRYNETTKKNMKSALPLGIVLGLAAVFFLEYMDRSLKSPEDLERLTGFASLGIIPSPRSVNKSGYGYGYSSPHLQAVPAGDDDIDGETNGIDLLPHINPRSPISEAYRVFRTSLLLASANSPRVMIITSSLPREGKTTTAVNLAVVLAQLGKPVLLIDADLRRPRLGKVFKTSQQSGLVNHLVSNAPLEQVVVRTQVPNLYLIEAGPIPPNPSELLGAEKMRKLVAEVRKRFAYVIIDTPPLLAVTDAIVLAAISDGVVLTVQGGETPRELVQRSAEKLKQINIPVLGTLLNNLDLNQHGYSFAKSYYSYYADDAEKPQRGSKKKSRQ